MYVFIHIYVYITTYVYNIIREEEKAIIKIYRFFFQWNSVRYFRLLHGYAVLYR